MEKAKNIKESDELEVKAKIGENFEQTENEFKNTILIYMFLIINIILLLIIMNKDIFFEKKIKVTVDNNTVNIISKDKNVTKN